MKKEESFLDFLLKNRFVIISLVIAFFLIASGILKVLVEIIVIVLVIMLALYVGKGLQSDKDFLKKMFNKDKKD